ncbi:mannosyltransferase [Arachnomyces sp. PD_36]|nr:mannosyltransferase [Arachnomyces sp. PD_36]
MASSSKGSQASKASQSNPKPGPQTYYVPLNVVFYLCLLTNVLAASLAPIQDCDEVFNYWEPTHFLSHGYGLQTWEYSPEYSIRSWFYVLLHAVIGKGASIFSRAKVSQFYFIRVVLGFVCAACQTRMYAVVSRTLNPRIGVLLIMVMLFSPGMFHSAAAYLPSSFTMYTAMLGTSAFMDSRGGHKIAQGIMWFGVGTLLGWPFAGALVAPFLLEEAIVSIVNETPVATMFKFIDGGVRCLLVLGAQVTIEFFFYRKVAVVPWNIVSYNVFGGEGRGPEIFGTEPWTFYIRNLLLNFNVWFILAMIAAPLLVLQGIFRPQSTTKQTLLRSIALITPFYMWLGIFTAQPHKEERFMYPAYPFLALNAAIALHIALSYIGSSNPKELIGRVPAKLKFIVVMAFVMFSIFIGLLRTVGMITAYNAPLRVFESMTKLDIGSPEENVCAGKEWYRFPSSYFLPNGMHFKFIRSEFRGLLPGEFDEEESKSLVPRTWLIPSGMNDLNEEDPEKYTDISQCSYLVDSYFPGDEASDLQPHYILDQSTWEEVTCKRFLDTSRTGLLGRVFWVPDWPLVPNRFRRQWGQYCLLRRAESDNTTSSKK